MNVKSSKKTILIKANISEKKVKKSGKYIANQQTLIASICDLKMSQKIVLAVVRIMNLDQTEQTIPIGFKLDRDSIPKNLKPYTVHYSNFIRVLVDGVYPLPAMIVSTGG